MAYGYADIAASTFGGIGSSPSSFQSATEQTQRGMIRRQYGRDKLLRDVTRRRSDIDREFGGAFRQLPGVFNRRGMLDSGSFVRGGRELAADQLRAQNRLRQDYQQALLDSYLEDAMATGSLSDLRERLSSEQYQAAVAGLYGDRARGAS